MIRPIWYPFEILYLLARSVAEGKYSCGYFIGEVVGGVLLGWGDGNSEIFFMALLIGFRLVKREFKTTKELGMLTCFGGGVSDCEYLSILPSDDRACCMLDVSNALVFVTPEGVPSVCFFVGTLHSWTEAVGLIEEVETLRFSCTLTFLTRLEYSIEIGTVQFVRRTLSISLLNLFIQIT